MNLFIPVAFIEHEKVKATLIFFQNFKDQFALREQITRKWETKLMLHNSATNPAVVA